MVERVVLRQVKEREFAVHREVKDELLKGDGDYCGGSYFWWSDASECKTKNMALTRAWQCFVDRANEHMAANVQLITD